MIRRKIVNSFWIRMEFVWLFAFMLLCFPFQLIAKPSELARPGLIDLYKKDVFDLSTQIRRDAKQLQILSSNCVNDSTCPELNCAKSTKLKSQLAVQLDYMRLLDSDLRAYHKLYHVHHIQLIKNSLQTGKNSANVQVALMWQRPLLEFGSAMFDIASVANGFGELLANPSVDGAYELVQDMKSAYTGIWINMREVDIEKAYPTEKAKKTHQKMINNLDSELGINSSNIDARVDEMSMISRMLEFIKNGKIGGSDINTFKSDLSNLKGFVDSRKGLAGLRKALKGYDVSKLTVGSQEYLITEDKKLRAQMRIAVLSLLARHLKDYAMADMKNRIKRMQDLGRDAIEENKVLASVNDEKVIILRLQEQTSRVVNLLQLSINIFSGCRGSRLCSGQINSSHSAILQPEHFNQALPYYVKKIRALTLGTDKLIKDVFLTDNEYCYIDKGAVPEIAAPTACPNTPPVPQAPTPYISSLGTSTSCKQCSFEEAKLREYEKHLENNLRDRDRIQFQLNGMLVQQNIHKSKASSLRNRIEAKEGQGISSVDEYTGVRIETRAQADGSVIVEKNYPDGRIEHSTYQQQSSSKLSRQLKIIEAKVIAMEEKIRPIRKRINKKGEALDASRNDVEFQKQSLEKCQRGCLQTMELTKKGGGIYQLPDTITNPNSDLMRKHTTRLSSACTECADVTSKVKKNIVKSNELRTLIGMKTDEFGRLMGRAEGTLRSKSQTFNFARGSMFSNMDNRIRLCEALGNKQAEQLFKKSEAGELKWGAATSVQFSVETKDSPGTLRLVRKDQNRALNKLLPEIKELFMQLRENISQGVELEIKMRECERKSCSLANPFDFIPEYVLPQCDSCHEEFVAYRRVRDHIKGRQDRMRNYRNEQIRLQKQLDGADKDTATQVIRGLRSALELTNKYYDEARIKMRNSLIKEQNLRGKLLSCNQSCPKYTFNVRNPDDFDVEIIQVNSQFGNNPLSSTAPISGGSTVPTGAITPVVVPAAPIAPVIPAIPVSQVIANLCIGKTITYTGFNSVNLQINQAANLCQFVLNTGTNPFLFNVIGGTNWKGMQKIIQVSTPAVATFSSIDPALNGAINPPSVINGAVTVEAPDINGLSLPRIRFDLQVQSNAVSTTVTITNALALSAPAGRPTPVGNYVATWGGCGVNPISINSANNASLNATLSPNNGPVNFNLTGTNGATKMYTSAQTLIAQGQAGWTGIITIAPAFDGTYTGFALEMNGGGMICTDSFQ